ncbi:DUF1616 domain-containing protein [Candidatus Woesearchaeota archaeon]|nr:DUF1616 domain-containing protein [Candidatus Woesearchaeota archaeon]
MISIISILGLLFALFIPGFLVTLIFFRESELLERIMLSITFSIMLSIAIGISLGYSKNVKEITGGINPKNVWMWELIITSVLFAVVLVLHRQKLTMDKIMNLRKRFKTPNIKLRKEKEPVRYKKL